MSRMEKLQINIKNLYRILAGLLIFIALLPLPGVKLWGVPLHLLSIIPIVLTLFGVKVNKVSVSSGGLVAYIKGNLTIFILILYTLLQLARTFFLKGSARGINMEFILCFLLSALIYWVAHDERKIARFWIDILILTGGLGAFVILLSFLQLDLPLSSLPLVQQGSGGIASYLMLPGIMSLKVWCFLEGKRRRMIALGVSTLVFMALLINQNHISLWVMFMVFLVIPCICRPRAKLIMRDMQLFFIYVFLWCNMSLISNYTNWIKVPIAFSLEASVYAELLLALGALVFFHFWDRIPKKMDLHFVSMVRLQVYYRVLVFLLFLFIAAMAINGGALAELSGEGFEGFLKEVFIPLANEVKASRSSFYLTLRETGPLLVIVIFFQLIMMGSKLFSKQDPDKELSNILLLLYGIFLIGIFWWDLYNYAVLVYAMLLAWGYGFRERQKKVKKRLPMQERQVAPAALEGQRRIEQRGMSVEEGKETLFLPQREEQKQIQDRQKQKFSRHKRRK